ncbi:MAG: hypothetical protein M1822_002519 [Bathelium mastoideum]|nr:MAG: hypothetical protein M1822_002519 [Bathelium mastoideum]
MSATGLSLVEETYQNAVTLFKSKYTRSEDMKKWLSDKNTLHDVEAALLAAKASYDVRANSRARRYLNKVSAGIMYYGNVMDMLVQHHPEYVSLGWGTMKLIFVLVLNHEELVTELAKALAKISDTLPRTQLHLVLYPTEDMKRVVEELYALLILFYQRALKWYQANKFKHIASALLKPFRLEFADLVERINPQARSIESVAITMAHQEIRSIYSLVQQCLSEQRALRLEQSKVTSVVTDSQWSQTQTLRFLASMKEMLMSHDARKSNSFDDRGRFFALDPRSNESLRRRIALCSRRQFGLSMDLDKLLMAPALKAWSLESRSSLLIVSGTLSTRPETLVTGTYITELIRSSKAPILWTLKGSNEAKFMNSTSDLFKYLAMQALQLNPNAISERVSSNFNAALVASATTEEDWLRILENVVSILPTLFIVIEADLLGSASTDKVQVQKLLELLQSFVRKHTAPAIKIAFFNYRKAKALSNVMSSSQNDRTHVLSLTRVMLGPSEQKKVVKLRFALRRQHASAFQQRLKRQASTSPPESNRGLDEAAEV